MARKSEFAGGVDGAKGAARPSAPSPAPGLKMPIPNSDGDYVHPETGMILPKYPVQNKKLVPEWEGLHVPEHLLPQATDTSRPTVKPQVTSVKNAAPSEGRVEKPKVIEEGIVELSGSELAARVAAQNEGRRGGPARVGGRQRSEVKNAAYFARMVKANGRRPIEGYSPREVLPKLAEIHGILTAHVRGVGATLRSTTRPQIGAGTGVMTSPRDFTETNLDDPNVAGQQAAQAHLDNAAHHINALTEYIKTPKAHFHHAYAAAAARDLLAAHKAIGNTDFPADHVPDPSQMATILDGQNRELGGGVIRSNGEYQPKARGNKVVTVSSNPVPGGTQEKLLGQRDRNRRIRVTPSLIKRAESFRGTGVDEAIDKLAGKNGTPRVAGRGAASETEERLVEQGRRAEDAPRTVVSAEDQVFGGRGRVKPAGTAGPKKSARSAGRAGVIRVDSQGNPIQGSVARTGGTAQADGGAEIDLNAGSRLPRPEDALRGLRTTPAEPTVVDAPVASEVTGLTKQVKDKNGNWVPVTKKAVLKRKVKSRVTGLPKQVQDKEGNWVPVTKNATRTGAVATVSSGNAAPTSSKTTKAQRDAAANSAKETAVAAAEKAGRAAAAEAARNKPRPTVVPDVSDKPEPGMTKTVDVENVTTAPAKRGRRVVSRDTVTRRVPNQEMIDMKNRKNTNSAKALRILQGSTPENEARLTAAAKDFIAQDNARKAAEATATADREVTAAAKKKKADAAAKRAKPTKDKAARDAAFVAEQVKKSRSAAAARNSRKK